jgi:hypothetical protein
MDNVTPPTNLTHLAPELTQQIFALLLDTLAIRHSIPLRAINSTYRFSAATLNTSQHQTLTALRILQNPNRYCHLPSSIPHPPNPLLPPFLCSVLDSITAFIISSHQRQWPEIICTFEIDLRDC